MIEIAGGIILAILFLALLPAIIAGAYWVAAAGVVLVGNIKLLGFYGLERVPKPWPLSR